MVTTQETKEINHIIKYAESLAQWPHFHPNITVENKLYQKGVHRPCLSHI